MTASAALCRSLRSGPARERGVFGLAFLVVLATAPVAGMAQEQDQAERPATVQELFDEIEDFIVLGKAGTPKVEVGTAAAAPDRPSSSGTPSAARREKRRRERSVETSGHLKLQGIGAEIPADSVLRSPVGSGSVDGNVDLRFNLAVDLGRFDFAADLQAVGLFGDTIELTRGFPSQPGLAVFRFQDDRNRYFDLTSVHHDEGRSAQLTRFDRLSLGYTGKRVVLRVGRQAVSWGNGFVYTPLDIFNPFDPAAVDKEFKPGDDMVYGQFLFPRGDDLQAVWVTRRDPFTGRFEEEQSSVALKYHGLYGPGEIDLLVAEHYDEDVYGFGGSLSIGGSVWRGDVVVTDGELDTSTSVVTGLTRSWMWGSKNVTGFMELFWNGFGQRDGRYSPADLAANPQLLERIARRELFSLGRAYAAGSVTVELTPLFLLTPNLFANLEDSSALLQIVAQNDLRQNLLLQTALGIPVGSGGTEFGGIDSGVEGFYLSSGVSLFVQLAWYF